jgi:hypothetical protein
LERRFGVPPLGVSPPAAMAIMSPIFCGLTSPLCPERGDVMKDEEAAAERRPSQAEGSVDIMKIMMISKAMIFYMI